MVQSVPDAQVVGFSEPQIYRRFDDQNLREGVPDIINGPIT
jgi:hypothetical protein